LKIQPEAGESQQLLDEHWLMAARLACSIDRLNVSRLQIMRIIAALIEHIEPCLHLGSLYYTFASALIPVA
jgi:hypothetical protein